MPVNLMQGKLDGDDKNNKKSSSIDLTLEKKGKVSDKPVEKLENAGEKTVKHPEVKEIKVKVPSDIRVEKTQSEGGSLKVVTGIVLALVLSTGILLFMLNSESQDLRGSVNVLPETNSTQIVDDILAEDFNNDVQENLIETDQVEVDQSPSEVNVSSADDDLNVDSLEVENQQVEDEDTPLVIDTSSIISETEGNESEALEVEVQVEPVNTVSPIDEGEIIQEYNIQSSAEVTNELLTDGSTNTNNDFSPEIAQSEVTVMEEVSESEEIQGETGPGLWISVIVASILSFAYARRDERQLD